MPTTFDQPVDGDVTHVSQINQYATAVNALENGTPYWGGDSLGGTTAYTASVTPAPGNNTAGTIVNLRMNATNTGATTLAVNGHTALPVRSKGAALAGGELQINGVYTFICDATYWHLVGIGGSASTNASTAFSSGQIPLARGGTGADLSATGGSGQFLKQSSAGGTITVGTIASGDLPNHSTTLLTSGQLALARGGTGADLSATGGTGQVLKQNTSGGAITVGTLTYSDVGAAAASHIHAASDITSGTIATARLGSGTADGTTFLAGDQTYKTISATDSTKLPLAGGTMTGALKMSGTVNIDAASMEMYPAGSGLLYRNVPTGGLYGECVNGAEVYQLGASGIAFPYAHSTPGTNVVGVYRDGSGNLCLGVGSGAGLIAKVAGSRAGGFPLTPSDIPARRTLIATLASQTLAGGYNRLAFASATRNDGLFTVSSNVFTAVANCVVQVSWAMYSASYAQVHPVVRKNASNYIQASPSQISAGCYASIPVELSTGDTLEVYAYSDTGSIDLDISIAALNKLIIVEA